MDRDRGRPVAVLIDHRQAEGLRPGNGMDRADHVVERLPLRLAGSIAKADVSDAVLHL